ncbi:MAG: hypothetical protein ACKO14_12065 [Armatimonadota bacterium]
MHKHDSPTKEYVVGYEHTDVKLAPLVLSFGGLVGLFVVASAGMMWFFNFTKPKYASDANVPGWSVERKLPAHPQLQANPKEEMNLFKEAEKPYSERIESAIDVVAKQGISGVPGNKAPSAFKPAFPGSRSVVGSSGAHKDESHSDSGHDASHGEGH